MQAVGSSRITTAGTALWLRRLAGAQQLIETTLALVAGGSAATERDESEAKPRRKRASRVKPLSVP